MTFPSEERTELYDSFRHGSTDPVFGGFFAHRFFQAKKTAAETAQVGCHLWDQLIWYAMSAMYRHVLSMHGVLLDENLQTDQALFANINTKQGTS